MDRGTWIIVTVGGMMILSMWAFSGLQNRAQQSQLRLIHDVLDEYDRDLGTYDSLTARNAPVFDRMRKNIDVAFERDRQNRKLLDSLSRECNLEFGMPAEMNSGTRPTTLADR